MGFASVVLNRDEEDCMTALGYKRNICKTILIWMGIICTGGLLGVIFYWRKDWFVKATCSRCSVDSADVLLLEDLYEDGFVSHVREMAAFARFYSKVPEGSVLKNSPLIGPSHDNLGAFNRVSGLKYFDCKRVRYVWNSATSAFEKLIGIPNVPLDYFDTLEGLDDTSRSQRLRLFGLNVIAVKVDPIVKILFKEGLTPFYAFQLFSIILWLNEPYYVYAGVIVGISLLSLGSQVFETRRQQVALHKRVQDHDTVRIQKQDGSIHTVSSETLVPGDVILIESNGGKVVCDSVLLSGNCIVNESSLTGESVPVPKLAIVSSEKEQSFNVRSHNRCMLFCGTKVLQARPGSDGTIRAVVIRTGFMTAKGELIRSIMFFRRVDFKFQNQTFWYILALACIAAVGMIYSIIIKVAGNENQRQDARDVVIKTLDLVTIVIPPALPAALTAGIFFSQRRLQKQRIFCISPRTINMCGLVNMVCFDKTGTLTEDGLDIKEVLPVSEEEETTRFSNTEKINYSTAFDPLTRAMTACHSLSLMLTSADGSDNPSADMTMIGDPLDLIMFKETSWKLEERTVDGFGQSIYRVVRTNFMGEGAGGLILFREYPFASTFQRMGVIAFNFISKNFEFYAKGATEKILGLCEPKTIPNDCLTRLHEYSSTGNRVIALAWKNLGQIDMISASKVSRSDAEKDLHFIGLIVFENRIKSDSPSVIEELTQANIRTVMLTGDNIHTAISVARTCGILRSHNRVSLVQADEFDVTFAPAEALDQSNTKILSNGNHPHSRKKLDIETGEAEAPLGLTGDTLQIIKKFHPHMLPRIVLQGAVFARVSPLEKQYMVEQFQGVGYQVAMCGDGANDCGALRAAHAGISLSESEAAAAAPFTSTNQSIACVLHVLREGRCALLTFFGVFFLMATYSMCQFISCVLLYWVGQNLTDMQFLYEDLFELTVLAIVLACTLPYHKLTNDPVPSSLKSFPALFALIGHVALLVATQIIAYEVANRIPCTEAFRSGNDTNVTGTIVKNSLDLGCVGYGVWTVGIFQIVILSFIFASGPPFRKHFWTNYYHMIVSVGMIVFDLVCMLGPTPALLLGLQMNAPSNEIIGNRFIFVGIVMGYLIAAVFFEKVIVGIMINKCLDVNAFRKLRSPRRKDIEEDLRQKVYADTHATKNVTYRNLAFTTD